MLSKSILQIIILLLSFPVLSQTNMRPVNELINTTEPAWTFVKQWIDSAVNTVEILPVDTLKAKDALFHTQVTTRSPMGAIVYMTGGLLIDNGWIRLLGSGNDKLTRTLPDWNKGKSFVNFGESPKFLLIADDVIGGFFLLNGGGLGQDMGKVYYWSPDNLQYEALNLSYSAFLNFCLNGDLEQFYKGYRWADWKTDVATMSGDEVFSFYPFLWTVEGKDMEKNTRKIVPVEEQYFINRDSRKQLGFEDQPGSNN